MFYTVIPFEEDNGKGDKDKIDTFLKYIETYVERAAKIQGYATSLLALSKEKSFNTIGILAPMFWNCVVSSFWCSIIIDITSFFDKDRKTDSFYKLLNFIKDNYKVIYTKKFYESKIINGIQQKRKNIQVKDIQKLVEEILDKVNYINDSPSKNKYSKLNEIKAINSKVAFLRNKLFAHKEKKLTIDDDFGEFDSVKIEEILKLNKFIECILSDITIPFDRCIRSFTPLGVNDVCSIINILKDYQQKK